MTRRFSRRPDQAGILLAGMNVPLTFQRTLMPRASMDQALVTGLSISSNQVLVTLVQESIEALAHVLLRRRDQHEDRAARGVLALDLAAIGAGVALQRAFRQREREPLGRAAARTSGFVVASAATAGALVVVLEEASRLHGGRRRSTMLVVLPTVAALAARTEWARRKRERLDADDGSNETPLSPARALALGLGVSGSTFALGMLERLVAEAVAGAAARALPGSRAVWRPLGHVASLAAFGAMSRALVQQMYAHIEAKEEAVETAFDLAPPSRFLSGGRDSHVPFATLAVQGRRFTWMATPEDVIERVMGEPAAAQPIRVYVGLESAPTEEERVDLALRELQRTGAFDRSWLMVVSPTGTGYVNYAAASSFEFLARGDCSTVVMQYAARPSVLSLDRVKQGRRHLRLLLARIRDRVAACPPDRRPKVVLFGESLGAWTSQDPFVDAGVRGLREAGIDYAIWIGTPHFSKWKNQVLHGGHLQDDDRAQVGVFNDIDAWRALSTPQRERLRYVMITHNNDGVALFGPELAIQAPAWLQAPESRLTGVPKGMRWVPTTTFFQVLVDMKNSANIVPGEFAASGHDYRADLLPFFHGVLGFKASDEQLMAIRAWMEQRERFRTEWIKAHGDAGHSLAAAVVEQWLDEERDAGRDPDESLFRLVRTVTTAWQGS